MRLAGLHTVHVILGAKFSAVHKRFALTEYFMSFNHNYFTGIYILNWNTVNKTKNCRIISYC